MKNEPTKSKLIYQKRLYARRTRALTRKLLRLIKENLELSIQYRIEKELNTKLKSESEVKNGTIRN